MQRGGFLAGLRSRSGGGRSRAIFRTWRTSLCSSRVNSSTRACFGNDLMRSMIPSAICWPIFFATSSNDVGDLGGLGGSLLMYIPGFTFALLVRLPFSPQPPRPVSAPPAQGVIHLKAQPSRPGISRCLALGGTGQSSRGRKV